MSNLTDQIKAIGNAEQKLNIKKLTLIDKAIRSDNPNDILTAGKYIQEIQEKTKNENKSYLIDPLQFNSSLGYKDKPFSLTYTTLRRMSKVPVINSIIKTRKNQIADFAEPQADRYSTGFVIRKKSKFREEVKMDKQDQKIANAITDFILNCGSENTWENDDFDTFIRKIVDDSLIFDQMTWENIRNRRGQLVQFIATDASSYRMADTKFEDELKSVSFSKGKNSWFDSNFENSKPIHGYMPSYVQIYQGAKVNEFYPWELCFGIRNPTTSVYANGYGVSELEDLINVVTAMLWGDEYNRRFFSQGSAPKGLLKVKGNPNEAALQQFKQQWQAMISGVMQSWKTPVVESDVEWIDLQKNNRDMEYTGWMEYLIKLSCAVYSIDPSEIGWDIARSYGTGTFGEGGQQERLKNSKDKGLYPLLKFIQRKINKHIVGQINPDFEFAFVGLNGMTISEEIELDIKKAKSFVTINEIREKWEMKPIENGDIIEDSVYAQRLAAQEQMALQKQLASQQQAGLPNQQNNNGLEENPFDFEYQENEEEPNPFETEKAEENSILKAFDNFLKQEENE